MTKKIILVDKNDVQVGSGEKLQVHKDGLLHRAFSIFVFNDNNELMIQKRHKDKYHSGGLWSETCCSHPLDGEDVLQASHRRLQEEMGFDCDLESLFYFCYKIDFENGLIEHEVDHVVVGRFNGTPVMNSQEAEDYKWVTKDDLLEDIKQNPDMYTYWFKKVIDRVLQHIS